MVDPGDEAATHHHAWPVAGPFADHLVRATPERDLVEGPVVEVSPVGKRAVDADAGRIALP
jgi:hypothetical protein